MDAETRTAAREIALQGAEAYEQKDYVIALDRFQRAYALLKAPSISVMEARSLAALGRLVKALDKYEETQRIPLTQPAPEAFRRAVIEARAEAEQLRARIPRLELRVRSSRFAPNEVQVTLDGKLVPPALLDVPRPVDPGAHEINASVAGEPVARRSLQLAESQSVVLELDLDREPRALAARAPRAESPRASELPSERSNLLGWTATGVGGIALALSAGMGLSAWSHKAELDARCKPGCPPELAGDLESFRTQRTISYVSLAIGTAGLATGGYLLLLRGTPDTEHVAAQLTPGGALLQGAF